MQNETWKEFGKNELTHSAAHYLMAIHELHESQGYARLVDVAKHLDISKGSLSTSIRPLIKKHFVVEDENKHFNLTPKGKAFVQHIQNSYSALEKLFKFIQIEEETAEIDACKIEHLLTGQTTHALTSLIKALEENPDLAKTLQSKINSHLHHDHCQTYKKTLED